MVKHARRDDQIEFAAELAHFFYRQPVEFEVAQSVALFEFFMVSE